MIVAVALKQEKESCSCDAVNACSLCMLCDSYNDITVLDFPNSFWTVNARLPYTSLPSLS